MPHRIYVVEDFERLRKTILDLIDRSDGLEASGSSGTAEAALQDLPEVDTDLMLVDISLPGMNGLDLIFEVRRRKPSIRCVVVSGHRSLAYAALAKDVGASAFVVKSDLYRLPAILSEVDGRPSEFLTYGLGSGVVL